MSPRGGGRAPTYAVPTPSSMDRRLRGADRPGAHLWVITAAWLIALPETARDPDVTKLLDRENLVALSGPGCWKCEEPYSPALAATLCRGRL